MAEDNELTLKSPAARKKQRLLLSALVVALLCGGGVAAWLLLAGKEAEPVGEQAAAAAPPARESAHYVDIQRPFIFNVAAMPRDRLVQIKIQLMVRGAADEALARQNLPLVEGTLLRVFSAATAAQLMSFEGKERLRQEALDESRRVLGDLVASPVVEQVLFTGFVMQ